jgi:hypothetical protein
MHGLAGTVRHGEVMQVAVRCVLLWFVTAGYKRRYSMVYKWKDAARLKTDAQTAGEICEKLEKNGGLTAKRLADESRPEDAPLHKEFEWNDATAAEAYR